MYAISMNIPNVRNFSNKIIMGTIELVIETKSSEVSYNTSYLRISTMNCRCIVNK
jgi:hypothetical protein